jgi:hypothetical protein
MDATNGATRIPERGLAVTFVAGAACTVAPWDRIRPLMMNQPTDKKIYEPVLSTG